MTPPDARVPVPRRARRSAAVAGIVCCVACGRTTDRPHGRHRGLAPFLQEELLEASWTHAGRVGDRLQGQVLVEVLLDERDGPSEPPRCPTRPGSARGTEGGGGVLAEPVAVRDGEPAVVRETPPLGDHPDGVVAVGAQELVADAVEPVVAEEPVRARVERPCEDCEQLRSVSSFSLRSVSGVSGGRRPSPPFGGCCGFIADG